jgi:uncharacterized protein YidB (DUF937 family)
MSLLSSVLGGVLQNALGGGHTPQASSGLTNILMGMLGGGGAGGGSGLDAILGQVTKAGFGKEAQSWVGTGANMPISPDAVSQIFGHGQVQQWSQQLGLSPQQTQGGLAAALPELINHLTPGGQVTQGAELDGLLGALKGLIK